MLPATHWIEKDGSFTNSGRWAQWKEQVLPPEGEARHDHWILAEVFAAGPRALPAAGRQVPGPVLALTHAVPGPAQAGAGRDRPGDQRQGPDHRQAAGDVRARSRTTAPRRPATGSTPATIPESGNLTKRRDGVQDPAKNDPTGMGYYPNWAWSWPLNRRVLYNRASADPPGKPWDPERGRHPVGRGRAGKWVGDVPDYPATADPTKPGRPAAVHHDRRGHGPAVQQRRGRRAVPRALRADRVADRQPAAPGGVGDAGRVPLRRRWPAGPTGSAPSAEFPYVATSLPADRARALRHPARRAAGRSCSRRPFVEMPGGARRRRRASRPATTSGSRPSAASSRCGRW